MVFASTQFRRPDAYAFPTVDSARWEDGGNDGSQALSGSGSDNRLWGRVGDVHPSDRLAPEVVGLGFNFSLGLKDTGGKYSIKKVHKKDAVLLHFFT